MENKFLKAVGYMVLGLIVLVATVIIIRWVGNFLDWARFDAGDLATWVGAFGTVAALFGTIVLATTETRRRERAEMLLAGLHASALLTRINDAYNAVANLRVQLGHDLDEGDIRASMLEYALVRIQRLKLWTVDELVALAPLPDSAASKLARVPDQVQMVIDILAEATIENPSDMLRGTRELLWRMAQANGEAVGTQENYFRIEAGRDVVRVLRVTEFMLMSALQTCREFSTLDSPLRTTPL